jgi:hypothetical protein
MLDQWAVVCVQEAGFVIFHGQEEHSAVIGQYVVCGEILGHERGLQYAHRGSQSPVESAEAVAALRQMCAVLQQDTDFALPTLTRNPREFSGDIGTIEKLRIQLIAQDTYDPLRLPENAEERLGLLG